MKKIDRFEMRADQEFLSAIDEWRRTQPDIPGRAEAVRRIVTGALTGAPSKANPSLGELFLAYIKADEKRIDEWSLRYDTDKTPPDDTVLVERLFFEGTGRSKRRSTDFDVKSPATKFLNALEGDDGPEAIKMRELLAPLTK